MTTSLAALVYDLKALVGPFGDLRSEPVIPKPASQQALVKSKRASARRLATEMRPVNKQKLGIYKLLLKDNRTLFAPMKARTQGVISKNGSRMAKKFGNNLNRSLKPGLRLSDKAQADVQKKLAKFVEKESAAFAKATGKTDLKSMKRGKRLADSERKKLLAKGKTMTDQQHADFAGKHFERNLRGRLGGQVTLETTTFGEGAKQLEVDAFKSELGDVDIMKRWDSQGDIRTRSTHLTADSQVRSSDEPFDVGGFKLMYPGDGSLGAPLKERARCRCASFISPEDVGEQLANAPPPDEPTSFTKPPKPKGKKKVKVPKKEATAIENAPKAVTNRAPYTIEEAEALFEYQESGFAEVNKYLRHGVGGQFGLTSRNLDFARKTVKDMRSALMKSRMNRNGVVWRGCNSNRVAKMIDGLKVGDVMPSRGFVSASASQTTADFFGRGATVVRENQQQVRMKINLKKGQHAMSPDKVLADVEGLAAFNAGEGELILSERGKFRVKRIWETEESFRGLPKETIMNIELDYIDDISGKSDPVADVIDIKAHEDDEELVEVVIGGPFAQRMYWSDQEAWGMVRTANLAEAQRGYLAAEETA